MRHLGLRRQFVEPDSSATTAHLYTEDAGVFCSRTSLKDYLKAGDNSGIFNLAIKRA